LEFHLKNTNKTYSIKASEIEKKWFVVDAEGKTLGRLAAQIAYVLRGKHKPTFTPHMDMGDSVIVINASKVKLTRNKMLTKVYHRHTGFFGGIKTQTAAEIMAGKNPERLVEMAVQGMLPHNRLGADCYGHLKVYVGAEHPHAAQNPQPLPERTVTSK
jgi:large subunit ribosomal protein L13